MAQLQCGLLAAVTLAFACLCVEGQELRPASRAILIDIDGAIGPATSEYVRSGLERASAQGARLVVLRMNTPGGLDSATREIIAVILASPVPVATYVSPNGARAASAGTYILYASHLAAMAPSTHLGAATPVQIGGGFGQPRERGEGERQERQREPANAAEAKAINDAVAYLRGLAQLRERNPDFAERAVREAATLTARDAVAQSVVEIIASDVPDLLRQLDGRSVRVGERTVRLETRGLAVARHEPDWRTRILATITNPNIAYLLVLVGLYGLLFEFLSPGAVAPGVIGGIALLIGLYALNLLPINYAGVALILLGIALMVAEAFVPSFGILGLGGISAFAVGSLFLFRGEVPGFQLSPGVIVAATAASALFLIAALAVAWRAHKRAVVTGAEALVQSAGRVLDWSNGQGDVLVQGERWRATSAVPLSQGQRVRVTARRDLTLTVEPDPDAFRKP